MRVAGFYKPRMGNVEWDQIKEGSVVWVMTNFGSGPRVKGTVTGKEEDVKHGQPGIDYTDEHGEGRWAYADQISGVVKY